MWDYIVDQRIIPILLLRDGGLYKGIKFKNYKYVGDPCNAIRVFNQKDVDELFLIDITATREGRRPNTEFIQRVGDECYMPFGIGGGIKSIDDIRDVLLSGAEKVSINTYAVKDPELIKLAANIFGSQSIIVSIDYKIGLFHGHSVYTHSGSKKTRLDPVRWAQKMEEMGAGEILLNSIDRDGTGKGLDLNLIKKVTNSVSVPVIACGGVGTYSHIKEGIEIGGATAVAAGSLFIFQGPHRSVLINYPKDNEWDDCYNLETLKKQKNK